MTEDTDGEGTQLDPELTDTFVDDEDDTDTDVDDHTRFDPEPCDPGEVINLEWTDGAEDPTVWCGPRDAEPTCAPDETIHVRSTGDGALESWCGE